jgi:hypothetical protein
MRWLAQDGDLDRSEVTMKATKATRPSSAKAQREAEAIARLSRARTELIAARYRALQERLAVLGH